MNSLPNLKRVLAFCLVFAITTAMGQSVITGLASSGAVSMVNNKFDLGKVASDLASPDSLYNLGLNSLTAGLTFGASQGLGIEQIKPGLELIDRAEIVAKNGLVGIGVRSALSAGTGDKLGNIIKDETLSGGLAPGQSVVGDIAQSKNFATGSIEKTALHALTGATYSSLTNSNLISGAIGGISSELVAGLMESSTGLNGPPLTTQEQHDLNNNIKATTKLTSATVTILAGGNAKDITLSANVGESAIKNNYVQHIPALLSALRTLGVAVGALSAEEVAVVGGTAVVGAAIATQSEIHEDSDGQILSTPLPEIQKPITLSTPVIENSATILSTPVIDSGPTSFITPEQNLQSWQRLPGYEAHDGPDTSVLFNQKLLPNEGRVGSYGELAKISKKDGLDAHHGPNDKYMGLHGISKKEGISILVRETIHREIHKKLKIQDPLMHPRDALAQSIYRTKEVYKNNNLYLPEMRQGLQEQIRQNKEAFPNLYKKD